jgi:ribonucleoside-diphosphate reductase alpha chain
MIRVVKLNGTSEAFSPQKLMLSILHAVQDAGVEMDGEIDTAVNKETDGSWGCRSS